MKGRIRIVRMTGMRGVLDEEAEKGANPRIGSKSEILADILDPRTELVERGTPDAPVGHVEQDYEDALVAPYFLRGAIDAEKEGFDAVIQRCHDDPGVAAAREACDIPIVSSFESACHVAAMLGRKFSLLISGRSTHPHGSPHLNNLVAEYGLTSKLASIRAVDLPPTAFNEDALSSAGLKRAKAILLNEARKAILEDGADVIITYGGPSMLEHLRANLDVPVIQGQLVAPIVAEMLVKLGVSQSKRTYPKPRHLRAYGAPKNELPERHRRPAERKIVTGRHRVSTR